MSDQEALRSAWLAGPEGKLAAREQAKAWALREVWQSEGKGSYGMLPFIAERLRKTKNGKPSGDHPTPAAVLQFFMKTDEDTDWFPGKTSEAKRGPKRVLDEGSKKSAVIRAAKRISKEEGEVTYSAMVSACPNAMINPATGEPVDKKALFTLFREEIYDDPNDPDDKWDHRARLSREALDSDQIQKRWEWAKWMTAQALTASWFFANVVWCDLCCSILPKTHKKAVEQARARKAGKFWGSKCSQEHSSTLRGPKRAIKMKSTDTRKVWFVPILTRGRLFLELLPGRFPGETEEGAALMVAKVRAVLNVRFPGGDAPKVLFTDRGNGFYESGSGKITSGYQDALRIHRLKAFMKADASMQLGSLQELMLHETAMAWVRYRLKKTVPKVPWEETVEEYGARLKEVASYIERQYDVTGLCRALPKRVTMLCETEGDRLPK